MLIYDIPEVKRENKTKDIVKRTGVLSASNLHLTNYPGKPVAIFNPGLLIEEDALTVYARMVTGYFMHPYSSAIVEFKIPIEELDEVSRKRYEGKLVIIPDTEYDMWGVEDPRATIVNGEKVLVYCGLTKRYYTEKVFRNLPVAAVYKDGTWKKIGAFKVKGVKVVGDKDAFLAEMNGLKMFQRPTIRENGTTRDLCVISEVPENIFETSEPKEIETYNGTVPIDKEKFEYKIGWGTPPLKVGKDEYLLILHAADMDAVYKAFAVLMNDKGKITAVTPHYIMEPQEIYEKYGDRPHVVFPTGIAQLDDEIIIAYGAADSFIGIGKIDFSEIMSILDSNRVY